ncbi:uncharacterized protein RHO25_004916 [Cercospora beticola]|uniref:Uncharacterized protein n=1 Tax=Cercospora beticola TaxID=122368 RepID=A0ABZ0NL50_CERBT|nr:hypothetical protein RHO25_004916 [Cercospora beticola]CAK1361505.1 unnamed protein product [Cercospora beticola]
MIPRADTTLDRQWLAASADFYNRQFEDKPEDRGAQFQSYFATLRLLATDVAILFAGKAEKAISDKTFGAGIKSLSKELVEFGHTIKNAFIDTSHFLIGDWVTLDFVLMEYMAIEITFKYQLGIASRQPLSAKLARIAIKMARLFDAIQYNHKGVQNAVLSCRAGLGIISLFIPKQDRYNWWCRRKFACIEQLGYIYPETFRKRINDIWSEDALP